MKPRAKSHSLCTFGSRLADHGCVLALHMDGPGHILGIDGDISLMSKRGGTSDAMLFSRAHLPLLSPEEPSPATQPSVLPDLFSSPDSPRAPLGSIIVPPSMEVFV